VSEAPVPGQLVRCLAEAQRRGFIGPGDLGPHIAHARGFIDALDSRPPPRRVVDLGSGGGLPVLVLAESWPDAAFWLVEAHQRRAAFLVQAVEDLGWASRVTVLSGRAEEIAREPQLRSSMDLVTARGFAPPGVTAECGAPFLRVGGELVVSEPPGALNVEGERGRDAPRWPAPGLAVFGLALVWVGPRGPAHYGVFRQEQLCDDRYPRRVGVPRKRPMF
jgi:16S rRNA (guanine527-N7)-methyltransferase